MLTRKQIYAVIIGIGLLAVLIAVLMISGVGAPPKSTITVMDYEEKLFSQNRIHSVDIFMEDWDGFLQTCMDEKYAACTVLINGERFDNVGIRGNGNSSWTAVSESGSGRYSFKLEFDHYVSGQNYHGLDKLNLSNLIHDNTMMKDYLTYQLMGQLGVTAPLCSYAQINVNKEPFGLYLAVEAMEESFLLRNYGSDYGELYKPDVASKKGNSNIRDVMLQYIDDDSNSYPNIFDNAKTDITDEDRQRLIQALKQLSTREKIKKTVDVEAVIRYFTVHTFVCNEDSYTGTMVHNYYLYEKDGLLTMLPWAYNLAFGGIPTSDAATVVNSSIYHPVSGGDLAGRPMLSWIFDSKRYTWLYEQYYRELLKVDMEALVERTATLITPYVQKDPTKFCTNETFETGIAALKQFLALRTESIQLQLSGKPERVDTGDLDLTQMGGVPPRAIRTSTGQLSLLP